MDNWEDRILSTMTQYFGRRDKALEWYDTPNNNLEYYRNPSPTPRHYVENGKAEELWEWIELCVK